jgi:hypothetical protein
MATIYLAARYSRHLELQTYAADLRAFGHTVTSRWIEGNHQLSDAALKDDHGTQGLAETERARFASEDWDDLMAADWCISFTEEPRSGPSRGGRHVEFGAAMATGKRLIVVGHRENVFHCLPNVEFFDDWQEAIGTLMGDQEDGPFAIDDCPRCSGHLVHTWPDVDAPPEVFRPVEQALCLRTGCGFHAVREMPAVGSAVSR